MTRLRIGSKRVTPLPATTARRQHAWCERAIVLAGVVLGLGLPGPDAHADQIGCVTTTWKLIGANHKVCVEAFDDPKIRGVTCHVSQARVGGIAGGLGLAEDPSQFSLACRQTGPIALPETIPTSETVFSEDTSLFFKETKIIRLWDAKRNTLVYVAISRRIIEGAPANSISTVPVTAWTKP
ncbi:MAG: CreA family protein [Methylotetracoccus sp.]|jgi:CreA protein|nr:CreA family protein [Methylotetracoccus sp.]